MNKGYSFKIMRFYFDESHPDHRKVIATGLTEVEAQAHCQREDTHEVLPDGTVAWFDGYVRDDYYCIACRTPLHMDADGTWVDETDGDCCWGDDYGRNENEPHLVDDEDEAHEAGLI